MTPTYFYGFSEGLLEVILHEPQAVTVPEGLVQDLWLHQRLDARELSAVDGTPIAVLNPGRLNTDAGPDFLGASLRIGSTLWKGAVEVHVRSGSWIEHGHERDPRYDATILHISLYHDLWTGRLRRPDGTVLPEVVLLPFLESPLRKLIRSYYIRTEERILCSGGWRRVADDARMSYIRSLAVERLREKSRRFDVRDREQAFYEEVFAALGYSKNAASMRTLATTVPYASLKHLEDPREAEALLMGAAGLLPPPADLLGADRETADYVMDLRDRFDRLHHLTGISPMPATAWRFFRLRPANFPPLRIAQAAGLWGPAGPLHADPIGCIHLAMADAKPLGALQRLLSVELDPFWSEHVRLDKRTRRRRPTIGRQRKDALIANVVAPLLSAVGSSPAAERGALRLLKDIAPSCDEITRLYQSLGTIPASELEVQGLHQLYRTQCSEARCLSCRIGKEVLAGVEVDDTATMTGEASDLPHREKEETAGS